jgi:hypothetical protein
MLLQLAIADSPLSLQISAMAVMGTFEMGTPECPIQSGIVVTIPGGVETNGIDVLDSGKYDVHGFTQASAALFWVGRCCSWHTCAGAHLLSACRPPLGYLLLGNG